MYNYNVFLDHLGVSVTFDPLHNDSEISRGCGSYMFRYNIIGDHNRFVDPFDGLMA